MPDGPVVLRAPARATGGGLRARLARFPHARPGAAGTRDAGFLDTFDGRVRRAGFALAREGGRLVLRDAAGGDEVESCAWRRARAPIAADELPAGPLRDRLAPLVFPRVLAAEFNARIEHRRFELADRAGGRVTPARRERAVVHAAAGKVVVEVLVLERGRRTLVRALARAGLRPVPRGWYDELRRAAGRRDPLPARPRTAVPPDAALRVLAAAVFRHLLRVMEQNEPGVRAGADPEFLHDFRVALRRTRSGLALVERVFPAAPARDFRERFARAAGACGELRDLDVMRLDLAAHRAECVAALDPGYDLLGQELEGERGRLHREFVAFLDGRSWRSLKRDWRAALRALASGEPMGIDAEEPARRVLGEALRRRHGRVESLLAGAESADDEALHRLRIACKKLRYAIEFLGALDPAADRLLETLADVQDALGGLNDVRVQSSRLLAMLDDRGAAPGGALRAAAIGSELEWMRRRREKLRARCGRGVEDLAGREFARAMERAAAGGA